MMRRALSLMVVVVGAAMASGCYYTATTEDGQTERISHEEYQDLKRESGPPTRVRVPRMYE